MVNFSGAFLYLKELIVLRHNLLQQAPTADLCLAAESLQRFLEIAGTVINQRERGKELLLERCCLKMPARRVSVYDESMHVRA